MHPGHGNHGCPHGACWSAAPKLAEVMLWLPQGLPQFCLQNEDLCCRTSAFYGLINQLLGLMRQMFDLVSRGRKNSRLLKGQQWGLGRASTTRNTESSSSTSTISWDGLCLSYCLSNTTPWGIQGCFPQFLLSQSPPAQGMGFARRTQLSVGAARAPAGWELLHLHRQPNLPAKEIQRYHSGL